jgi:PBP1b-binding outer membrane lipoprotein LpoB
MTKNTDTQKRPRRRTLLFGTSLFLIGGLMLSGCAAGTTSSSTSSTGASTTTSSTTGDLTVAEATTEVTESTSNSTAETITNTTAAVEAFLATLSDDQVEAVTYDYDDETKTTSWSNFPVTFVDRAGLNIADLTEEQQVAALQVMEALLSDEAYETVSGIIGGDQYLNENSTTTEDSLGQYYIAFFDDASDTSTYEVQFGGHHLGINATLDGTADTITFAPTHLGVQPAGYTSADGTEVQPFDGTYTDAFAFYDSLTETQQATLTSGDVTMCAPGDTCDFTTGTGLLGADLTDEQQELLLDLIANWSGMADEQSAATTRAEIEATLDTTVIAWSGETTYDMTTGDGINFSISGPNVYVAFQAQNGSAGADVDGVSTSGWGHVHTIYRDPTNDYADSVEQQAATGGMSGGAPGDGGTPPSGAPGNG